MIDDDLAQTSSDRLARMLRDAGVYVEQRTPTSFLVPRWALTIWGLTDDPTDEAAIRIAAGSEEHRGAILSIIGARVRVNDGDDDVAAYLESVGALG